MSVENVTKFYNEVLKDGVLKGKLSGVNQKTLTKEVFESKVLPEVKAKGYDFTYEDVQEYYKKQSEKTELNLDELENVSGGVGCDEVIDIVQQVEEKVRKGTAKWVNQGESPHNPICGNFSAKPGQSAYNCGSCNNIRSAGNSGRWYCEASCAI